jgi:hypothetical protein
MTKPNPKLIVMGERQRARRIVDSYLDSYWPLIDDNLAHITTYEVRKLLERIKEDISDSKKEAPDSIGLNIRST